MDANDNELAYLEAIHFFVEVLDSFFGNVCELDLVFNFYKVRMTLFVISCVLQGLSMLFHGDVPKIEAGGPMASTESEMVCLSWV